MEQIFNSIMYILVIIVTLGLLGSELHSYIKTKKKNK